MLSQSRWGWLILLGAAGCGGARTPFPADKPATTLAKPTLPATMPQAVGTPIEKGGPPRSILLPDIFGKDTPNRSGGEGLSSPAGTWKWTSSFGDQVSDNVLILSMEGNRLMGTLSRGKGKDLPITDPLFREGEVSFTVIRDRKGEKFVSKYVGKVQGDTIRGTVEFDFGGEQGRKRDWEATRVN